MSEPSGWDASAPPRTRVKLPVSLGLLGGSLAAAIVMAVAGVPVVSVDDLGWLVALTVAMAAVRVLEDRLGATGRGAVVAFWVNLALAAAAVWFSPAFGLYLFLGYYESGRLAHPAQRIGGMVGTAMIIAVAQVGGPRSALFTPLVYAAFLAVNLLVTGLMMGLDRNREKLFTELSRANAELRAEQRRSALLRDQLVLHAREAGIADERARLSREIHDTVAQDLVAIIAQLEAASGASDPADRERRLQVVDAAAREALAEARRAVRALASPRLDDTALPLALDDLLGQWRDSTGLGGELTVVGAARSSEHDDALLRIAQEALSNVARHARARRADLALGYGDGVELVVRDDGVGFDPDAVRSGYGLAGMRARMAAVGGRLAVESTGGGTVVTASVPLGEGAP